MEIVNYTEFRKHLKANLDQVINNNDVIIVSRSVGKNVVIISLDEYNSWQETEYLLRSEANSERLKASIKRAKDGYFESHNLIEDD